MGLAFCLCEAGFASVFGVGSFAFGPEALCHSCGFFVARVAKDFDFACSAALFARPGVPSIRVVAAPAAFDESSLFAMFASYSHSTAFSSALSSRAFLLMGLMGSFGPFWWRNWRQWQRQRCCRVFDAGGIGLAPPV
jgi:hypothetical protein